MNLWKITEFVSSHSLSSGLSLSCFGFRKRGGLGVIRISFGYAPPSHVIVGGAKIYIHRSAIMDCDVVSSYFEEWFTYRPVYVERCPLFSCSEVVIVCLSSFNIKVFHTNDTRIFAWSDLRNFKKSWIELRFIGSSF